MRRLCLLFVLAGGCYVPEALHVHVPSAQELDSGVADDIAYHFEMVTGVVLHWAGSPGLGVVTYDVWDECKKTGEGTWLCGQAHTHAHLQPVCRRQAEGIFYPPTFTHEIIHSFGFDHVDDELDIMFHTHREEQVTFAHADTFQERVTAFQSRCWF